MVYKCLDKKIASLADKSSKGSGFATLENKNVAEEFHKPIIRKLEKQKIHSSFKSNIWGANLADMQLISVFNTGIRFLLSAIDIFNKYAWVVPVKDKNRTTITNVFQKNLDESGRKPNKIYVDKDSKFCNRSMESSLEKNNIEMYSAHNEGNLLLLKGLLEL